MIAGFQAFVQRAQFSFATRLPAIMRKVRGLGEKGKQIINEGDFILGKVFNPVIGPSIEIPPSLESVMLEPGKRYELIFEAEGVQDYYIMPGTDILREPRSGLDIRVYKVVGYPAKGRVIAHIEVLPQEEREEPKMLQAAPVLIGIIAVVAVIGVYIAGKQVNLALKEIRRIVISPTLLFVGIGLVILALTGKMKLGK